MADSNTKGGSTGGPSGPPEPGTNITFYVGYPDNGKTPNLFIMYDETNYFSPRKYLVLENSISDGDYGGYIGHQITVKNLTSTAVTLQYSAPLDNASYDPTKLKFAPIYLT